jgi:ABC-2 type transport system ATP-binding protein
MADHVVAVEGLSKRYGDVIAVDDVSFAVERGEIFGILGRNGCGKTTTVECLQGLRRPDAGRLEVLGMDPQRSGRELRGRCGSQLQESSLPDRMKVWEALAFFSSLVPSGPPWRQVLEQWDLTEKRNATFASLSGGQRQRLFVALAVVNAPLLVFFDEMTTGLDPVSRRVTWELVDRLRAAGTTVVLVTHFLDEAEVLCDRVAVFANHRVVAVDRPAALVERFGRSQVVFTTDVGVDFLRPVPGIESIDAVGRQVTIRGTGPLLARVAAALVDHGQEPLDLRVERPSLEQVFVELTATDAQAGAGS